MTDLEARFNLLNKLGHTFIKLQEDIGIFKENQIVSVSVYAYDVLKKHYETLQEIGLTELLAENPPNVSELPLDYIIENKVELKQALANIQDDKKTIEELRKDVHTQIFMKDRATATEMLVEYFCRDNYVYAVRSDDKKEIWIYEDGVYTENGETYIAEFCRHVLRAAYTSHLKNMVVEKIQTDHYINSEVFFEFNKDLDFVPVQNGLLNIKTGELCDYTPHKIFFAKIPVVFNPAATCPKIEKFITDICGDIQDVETITQFIGSCLVREQRWEKMLMCIGGGRNGKSKLAELIKTFLGAKTVAGLQPSSFEDSENFQIHMLHGRLVNMYMDISRTALKNTSLLKSLSGRETVTVPRKFKTALTFKNSCKFIFGANDLPMSYDITDGFWGRWLLITLPYSFKYQHELDLVPTEQMHKYKLRDDNIIEKITSQDELSGMLNWILKSLQKLLKQSGFSYKYTTEEVKSLWIRKSDSFMAFYMDCCVSENEQKIPKQELQRAYAAYCREHGIKISTPKRIANALNELGCYDGRYRVHADDFYYWENVGFKSIYIEKTDANGFQYYKAPTLKDKIINFVKTQTECRTQDLKVRFGSKIVEKLLLEGVFIENKKDLVRLNK